MRILGVLFNVLRSFNRFYFTFRKLNTYIFIYKNFEQLSIKWLSEETFKTLSTLF